MSDDINLGDESSKGGQPSPYDPDYARQAAKLVQFGATDIELADFFKVSVRTIYRWKHAHEEFCQAVKGAGKELADERVERSLYQRAVGYSFESEKVFNNKGRIVRTPVIEHVPPDPGAAMNWLKNRKPDDWRDKKEVDANLSGQVKIVEIPAKGPMPDDDGNAVEVSVGGAIDVMINESTTEG